MSTTIEFIEFVCGQIEYRGTIRYRKMFGEYMVYINGKPILLVCDNTVFVKRLPETEALLHCADTGFPYDGAREHFILDVENRELTSEVLSALESVTPLPKPRKRKG